MAARADAAMPCLAVRGGGDATTATAALAMSCRARLLPCLAVPLCTERDFAAAAAARDARARRWGIALAALQKFSTRLAQFREKALAAPSVSKTLFFAPASLMQEKKNGFK